MARKRKNGWLQRTFGTRETVYPMKRKSVRRSASGRAAGSPQGTEVKYQGVKIRKTLDGDWSTSIDWDSRFDSLTDAKHFVKSWQQGMSNPRKLTKNESNVIAAVQNENGDLAAAWNNAHVYADQYAMTANMFRAILKRLFHFDETGNPRTAVAIVTSSVFRTSRPATRAALITLSKYALKLFIYVIGSACVTPLWKGALHCV